MKKLIIGICLCTIYLLSAAQVYVNPSFSYYNGVGEFKDRAMATVEVGKTIKDVLNLGIVGGVLNFRNYDAFVEFRPSVVLLQNKNVSVTGALGGGYIFNSPQRLLVEYGGAVNYAFNDNVALSVSAGVYKFNGKTSSSTASYVGSGLIFSFK